MIKNHGFQEDIQKAEDYVFGSKLKSKVINPTGDWTEYIPKGEPQNKGFETNACVLFGTNNAVETYLKYITGRERNYSERALGIVAGTDPTSGTSPHKVAETIRKKLGCVPESALPFDNSIKNVNEFYSPKPLPSRIVNTGKDWLKKWSLYHEWIFTNNVQTPAKEQMLKEALKRGTVCVSVLAWIEDNGIYTKPVGASDTHWVQLVRYDGDNPIIYDSYAEQDDTPYLKKLSKGYDFGFAKVYHISKAEDQLSIMQQIINLMFQVVGLQKVWVDKISIPKELNWEVVSDAKKLVKQMCIDEGLSDTDTKELMKTIQCESGFKTKAINKNKGGSVDYGIVQINDYYWIGKGKRFPSSEYVLNNPKDSVMFMIEQWKRGRKNYWVCYKKVVKNK
jgi:hypothetical protein